MRIEVNPYHGFSAVQEGFRQCHGLQCGYCTPGMVIAATALIADQPDLTDDQIRAGLGGNLCRCTGYQVIVSSVRWAIDHPAPDHGVSLGQPGFSQQS